VLEQERHKSAAHFNHAMGTGHSGEQHMNPVYTLAVIAATTGSITTVSAGVIGIDNRNGFDADTTLSMGSDHDQFRDTITALGHTIVFIDDFTNLAGIDALIVQNPHQVNQLFSGAEMDSIANFVGAGGGMLAHGEAGGASSTHLGNMNMMTAPFEAQFQFAQLDGAGLVVSDFVEHAVTNGVSQVGLDFYRKVTATGSTMDLTGDASDFIAARDGIDGAGNTVFLGDISLWKDAGSGSDYGINDFDNELLLQNIMGYIVPAPSAFSTLAVCGLICIRRRR
jgi:hypothetical protein